MSAAVVAAVATVLALGVVPASATAIGLAQSSIASPLPNGAGVPGTAPTPNIVDGAVLDAEEMSNGHIVVAGNFTQVQDMATAGQPTLNRPSVFSFDPTTGVVDSFAPAISGVVNAVWPGPVAGTVYLGGAFTGPGRNLVLLDLTTGAPVSGFNPPGINGAINDMEVAGGRLFLGGVFTAIGGISHGGLATLNPTTGALDPYLSIDVAVHHNWTPTNGWAKAPVGVTKLDVSSTGDRMAIIGNFKQVEGFSRDQAAVLDLPSAAGSSVTVDPWMTAKYQAPCAKAFDSYVRGVQWSPDGTYFVITATGGGGNTTSTYCDSAARFNWPDPNGTTSAGASAYWIDYTGNDTLYSVAISGSAVYVGGHERWLNNPLGVDKAGPGAVPRPGVAALDPLNGLPLTWNPGRNPRGVGAQTLLLTSQVPGLYVGSDTDYIGVNSATTSRYLRKKIAFFPLSGAPLASQDTSNLTTGQVYLAGTSSTSTVISRTYDGGSGVGPDQSVPNGGIPWSATRGGVWIGGNLYYGRQDPANGNTWELVRQPFDGSTFGSPTFITTPYKDPVWDGVNNGSGSTYDGAFPNFYASGELGSVTGMFYWNGQLFYTKSGSSSLFSRGLSVDSGIVSARSTTVPGVSIPNASGMFINGSSLYTADTTGRLFRRSFNPTTGAIGSTATQVSGPGKDSENWATRNLFVAPKPGTPPPNSSPTASFTAPTNCVVNTPCSFTSTSSDPDGDTLTYSWNFGDSTSPSTSATTSHTFAAAQQYDVTLTVNDGHNPAVSVDHLVTVSPATTGSGINVVGHAGANSGTSSGVGSLSVTLPGGISKNDGIVVAYTTNNANQAVAPNGYTVVGTQTAPNTGTPAMTTTVFQRVADGTESGSNLTVALPAGQMAKAALQVVVYHGTSASGPVASFKGNSDASQTSHVLPTASFTAGQWVLGVWADKSSSIRNWTPPPGYTQEDQQAGIANGGSISGLLADQAENAIGSVTGVSATTSTASTRGIMITLVIAPA